MSGIIYMYGDVTFDGRNRGSSDFFLHDDADDIFTS